MNMTRVGKKGQISIPKAVLDQSGIEPESFLLVEVREDGSILLRPAGVYPVEIYSEARVGEFSDEDRLTDKEVARLRSILDD
jgi:AbrB family looped-hinge helix DNA binding protein